jgi:hemoglobin
MMKRGPELFAKIGHAKLRTVITDFYARIFGDLMIGFLFEGKSRQHLIDREYEFTANLLGGDVKYTGRPMREAHAKSPIFGGHFERRLQILRETLRDHAVDPDVQEVWIDHMTLRDHAVDPDVQEVWIDHTLALRPQITTDKGSECKNTSVDPAKLETATGEPERRIKLGRR